MKNTLSITLGILIIGSLLFQSCSNEKTADKKMYILSLVVSTDTAMNIQFQDDTGTPVVIMEQMYFAANGGAALTFPPQAPLICDTNKDFDVIASVAGNISVTITGYLAP